MRVRSFLVSLTVALSIVVGGAFAREAQRIHDWDTFGLPDRSTNAAYFRKNAMLQLGREQRLRNGVSWRLVTDLRSGIAMPRLAWARDRRHLLAANRWLEEVQAGDVMLEATWRRSVEQTYVSRVEHAIIQKEVALTYAGERLISLVSGGWFFSSGSHPATLQRGLTFDVETATMAQVTPCHGVENSPDGRSPLFTYGPFLDLCDMTTYRRFISLVKKIDDTRPVRHLAREVSDRSKGCWLEDPEQPLVREDQGYTLYLTFTGLAVQVSGAECPPVRTPDNPIIVPYRQLEPFLLPGPWRDELLALR